MIKDIRPSSYHGIDRSILVLKIRSEHLNEHFRRHLADPLDDFLKMRCPSIYQIIPSHRGNHHMFELHPSRGFSHAFRLISLQRHRFTSVHRTEPTRACTTVPRDHKGSGSLAPAFPMIWAAGAFTHGMKVEIINQITRGKILTRRGQLQTKPFR